MAAQNFDLAPKFPQNVGFQPQVLHFSDDNIWTRKRFSELKIFGGGNSPPYLSTGHNAADSIAAF